MSTRGEIIKELAERLECQWVIDDLRKIQSMEELKEYIEKLSTKNENRISKDVGKFGILFVI